MFDNLRGIIPRRGDGFNEPEPRLDIFLSPHRDVRHGKAATK
jgi:hypothetical protein